MILHGLRHEDPDASTGADANIAASTRLPDAAARNWVDRFAPEPARPWLKLARLDRPAGAWLLLLPGWEGICLHAASIREAPDLSLMARFAFGAVIMRGAGCAFNDVVDRNIDAKVARTAGRPVASGQISVPAALGFVIVLCLAGLIVLVTMNTAAGLLGVASLGLVAAYPFMKRVTWWPQAWLGLTFNWGALMGYAAASGGAPIIAGGSLLSLSSKGAGAITASVAPVFLYLSGVFWTLGYDTIYALQDIEDDALAGVKSSARRLGDRAPVGVGVFYGLSTMFAALAGWSAGLSLLFFLILIAFALHLARQLIGLRLNDGPGALRRFRSNRDAGLLLTCAVAAGAVRLKGGLG